MKSNPFIATPTAEIPALAVMKPATIARMPLVMPFKMPGGIELINLEIAELTCQIHLKSVPNAVPSPEMTVCISELLNTLANDAPTFLIKSQLALNADPNAWNAPVLANEVIKLLTDVVAIFRACEMPLAMSPNTEPMPCINLLPSILLNSCLIELEMYVKVALRFFKAPVFEKPFQSEDRALPILSAILSKSILSIASVNPTTALIPI